MHICCANCAIYPIMYLKEKHIELSGIWFNPNIHPFKEYEARMLSVRDLASKTSIDVNFIDTYGLVDFLRNTVYKEGVRCQYCYKIRFDMTARMAKEGGFDGFTTSLLISPYQDRGLMLKIAQSIADAYGIIFYDEDLRPLFKIGRKIAKEMGFYQQKYCGCVYSEMERYRHA